MFYMTRDKHILQAQNKLSQPSPRRHYSIKHFAKLEMFRSKIDQRTKPVRTRIDRLREGQQEKGAYEGVEGSDQHHATTHYL